MPDIKHNFTGGKMNKDLDERLIPNGEYRDAMNVQVSTSEGSDVGTVQNILGNIEGCSYELIPPLSFTVGSIADEKNDTLYWLVSGQYGGVSGSNWNQFSSVYDMIIRKTPTKCEHVFVDQFAFTAANNTFTNIGSVSQLSGLSVELSTQIESGWTVTGLAADGSTSNTVNVLGVTSGNLYDANLGVATIHTASEIIVPLIDSLGTMDVNNNVVYLSDYPTGVVLSAFSNATINLFDSSHSDYQTNTIVSAQIVNFTIEVTQPFPQPPIYNPVSYIELTLQNPTTPFTGGFGVDHIQGGGYLSSSYNGSIIWGTLTSTSGVELPIPFNFVDHNVSTSLTVGDPVYLAGTVGCIGTIISPTLFTFVDCSTGVPLEVPSGNSTFTLPSETVVSLDAPLNLNSASPLHDSLIIEKPRVLNFDHNDYITGINIIDDMLFWTDGKTEPKKINISRSVDGTQNISQNATGLWVAEHTRLMVEGVDKGPVKEEHITVIRKAPLTPPHLEMLEYSREGIVSGSDVITTNTSEPFLGKVIGNEVTLSFDEVDGNPLGFQIGDIILMSDDISNLPNEPEIRVSVLELDSISTPGELLIVVKIESMVPSINLEKIVWYGHLEQEPGIFKRKLPRFAYRYKYEDGEYSSFSPFTQVAFMPGNFNYQPIKAYNTGMVNSIQSLKIQNFVTPDLPLDVVSIDLLYKNETNPTIYLLKTISPNDSVLEGEDENSWNSYGSFASQNNKGSYSISSENISQALPSSQSLRSWDNVPKRAVSQEITGNRVVYGNYTQGYDSIQPQIKSSINSRDIDINSNVGKKSIKSLRDYDIGVVWGDKYGRETPVKTSGSLGSINVPKSRSISSNYINVELKDSPDWAEYYRVYIKETSNEYYNLAVDRVYDADDGNIWVSFPSVDRNKVDEDTYIILKKGVESSELVSEEARYKIVAIENEAPEYIKTTYERLVRTNTDISRPSYSCNMYGGSNPCDGSVGFPGDGRNAPTVGMKGFSINSGRWMRDYSVTGAYLAMGLTSPKTLLEEVSGNTSGSTTDELYVSFSKETTTGGVTTISPVSTKYHVVNVSDAEVDYEDDFSGFFYINLDRTIKAEDEWITENLTTATGITGGDNIHIHFWKKTIINKPEFDGRFFVKIIGDESVRNRLTQKSLLDQHLKIAAATSLYKIEDSHITAGGFQDGVLFSFAQTGMNYPLQTLGTNTYSKVKWKNLLKFGGNDTKGAWFIDKATFAGRQEGVQTLPSNGKLNYDNVITEFSDTTLSIIDRKSCDTTTNMEQEYAASCWYFGYYTKRYYRTEAIGNGLSTSSVAMKGVWSFGSNNFIDLAYSELGPDGNQNPTQEDHWLDWRVGDPLNTSSDEESSVVEQLKPNTRFRLKGGEAVYKIKSTHKFRLFNFQGKMTIYDRGFNYPPSWTGDTGINREFHSTACGWFQNNKYGFYSNRMGEKINRRLTYRIKYEVDSLFTPSSSTVTTIDQESNYSSITKDSAVELQFLTDYTEEGENPISSDPAIFETEPKEEVNIDIYYEASSSLATLPLTNKNKHLFIPIGSTITPPAGTSFPSGIFISSWRNIDTSLATPVYIVDLSAPITPSEHTILYSTNPITYVEKDNGEIASFQTTNSSITNAAGDIISLYIIPKEEIGLNWFNCWSFNNGVESNRIGDTFNKPYIANGATASSSTEDLKEEENRKNGLIYSGIYNTKSGINNLNQFISAEKITKDINPTYGSIQKLHAGWGQGGDLVALCEDRVLKILANKDALFNADGNSNLTSTNTVLGQAIPYSGDYGISKNPESLASDAYRIYFTDKVRGAVMRLSMDGLTPISNHGMKDWFRDNLKLGEKLIGSYDDRNDEYNVVIKNDNGAKTVTFKEDVKGWVSFKSFTPENAISCANEYYTFKDGVIWKHHDETVNRNTFYAKNASTSLLFFTPSTLDVVFNESPGSVKTFHTLNYEGSQSKIDQLTTYDTLIPGTNVVDATFDGSEYYNLVPKDGWYVQSIKTDLEEGSLNEFIEKEGKWFNYIKGVPGNITDGVNINGFSNYNTSFQGLGMLAASVSVSSVYGCTDCGSTNSSTTPSYTYPTSSNCNPGATIDDGSCKDTVPGCTDPASPTYDVTANWDIWANTNTLSPDACHYLGCTDSSATNYDAGANYNDGSCNYPVIGCTDNDQQMVVDSSGGTTMYPMYSNFDINADTPCDGVNDLLQPCVADASGVLQTGPDCCCNPIIFGCTDATADNYDPLANTNDYSCIYTIYGCLDSTACEYDALANTDDGSCTWCGNNNANNYDGEDGFGDPLASCNTGCVFCKDPINFQTTGNVSPTEIEVSWQEVIVDAPVDIYKIRYRIAGSSDPWITSAAGNGGVNGNTITYGINGLTQNTSYDIQLKAVCVPGQSPLNPTHFSSSAWSSSITQSTMSVPVPGCTDEHGFNNPYGGNWVCNYNPDATIDDSSCDYDSCTGCTDSTYQEYCGTCWDTSTQTVVADGSGTYWLGDNGSCLNQHINGCTDPTAWNYDSTATQEDGSCIPFIYGCMDNTTLTYDGSTQSPNSGGLALAATNYAGPGSGVSPEANTDDGSCTYIMPTFLNWDVVNLGSTTSAYRRIRAIYDVTGVPQFDDNFPNGVSYKNTWDSGLSPFNTATFVNNPTPTSIMASRGNAGSVNDVDTSTLDYNGDYQHVLRFVFNNPNIPTYDTLVETYTVQNLPGCLDPTATCNYPTDPALLATFSTNSTCIYPSGCGDSSAYNYDATATCPDNSTCTYCETDPDVVNATLTTITANNAHTINWANMGTYNTNGTYTDEVNHGWGVIKPAYEVLYKYKLPGGSWTSSWATMAGGASTIPTIALPAPCNANFGRRIETSGIVISYSSVGISGATGAFNTGTKWRLKVRNYCTDCGDGGYLTTPILEIT